MFMINAFSAVFLIIGTIVTGEIAGFYEFAMKYPDVFWKIGLAAIVGSFGQIFIFMMISQFGPLPWFVFLDLATCFILITLHDFTFSSIVTTTRKFFTVLISVIFMRNPLTVRQSIATAIVFAALFADAFFGKKQLCGKKPEAVPTEDPDLEKNGLPAKSTEMESLEKKKSSE